MLSTQKISLAKVAAKAFITPLVITPSSSSSSLPPSFLPSRRSLSPGPPFIFALHDAKLYLSQKHTPPPPPDQKCRRKIFLQRGQNKGQSTQRNTTTTITTPFCDPSGNTCSPPTRLLLNDTKLSQRVQKNNCDKRYFILSEAKKKRQDRPKQKQRDLPVRHPLSIIWGKHRKLSLARKGTMATAKKRRKALPIYWNRAIRL